MARITGDPVVSADVRPARMSLVDAAKSVAMQLRAAGYETYFAGGCVRDALMQNEIRDYDIATSATPEQVNRLFSNVRSVGEAFGVILVRRGGHTFEVGTFREDLAYHDGRRPSGIRFSTAELDVSRRDFTINGLFMDPESGNVVDFTKGQGERDIRDKIIRAIGDPHARIEEDRLRMLRAVRFAARFGFTIESATAEAIGAHATELRSTSPERIGEELRKMLTHASRGIAAETLESVGLDATILGMHLEGVHALRVCALSVDAPCAFVTALAAWILDRAERGGALGNRSLVVNLRTRLVLSNDESVALDALFNVRNALLSDWERLGIAARCRLIASLGFDEALKILETEAPRRATEIRAEADQLLAERVLPRPFVDGDLLISKGFQPSKEFKALLHRAMDAQLEGRIASAEEGLRLLFGS